MSRPVTAQKLSNFQQNNKESDPQYSIYIFHPDNKTYEGCQRWEKKHQTNNLNLALKRARVLYGSQKYERVEVIQKHFDAKNDRNVDTKLKTFEKPEQISGAAILKTSIAITLIATIGLGVWLAF